MKVQILLKVLIDGLNGLKNTFFSSRKDKFGFIASSSSVQLPFNGVKHNVYIYENCGINVNANFICQAGKFILKRNCSIGPGFTVITFNHQYTELGQRPESPSWSELIPQEVIVNEDVWIGANVTLCPGVVIGRGAVIAAGSVCIKNIEYPPYSIIGGNPAKFIKFRLTLDDQIRQEELLYDIGERLSTDLLKYFYLKNSKTNA